MVQLRVEVVRHGSRIERGVGVGFFLGKTVGVQIGTLLMLRAFPGEARTGVTVVLDDAGPRGVFTSDGYGGEGAHGGDGGVCVVWRGE